MIARLKLWIVRLVIEREIRWMEADLVAIDNQRKNDNEAEHAITFALVRAKRRLQAMAHAEVNQTTADLLRRTKL